MKSLKYNLQDIYKRKKKESGILEGCGKKPGAERGLPDQIGLDINGSNSSIYFIPTCPKSLE